MTPDNPLYFLTRIPPKVRIWVYLVASLAAFAYSIWQASNQNPAAFLAALIVSLVHAMAVLYVPQAPPKDGQK